METKKYTKLLNKCVSTERGSLLQPVIQDEYAFACDGKILVRVPAELANGIPATDKTPNFEVLLNKEWGERQEINLKDYLPTEQQLEAMKVRDNRCPECLGSGKVECDLGHDHDCPKCEGFGYLKQAVPVSLLGINYNWTLLRIIFEAAMEFFEGKASIAKTENLMHAVCGDITFVLATLHEQEKPAEIILCEKK